MEPGMDRARLADDGRRAARKLYVDGLAGSEIADPLEGVSGLFLLDATDADLEVDVPLA